MGSEKRSLRRHRATINPYLVSIAGSSIMLIFDRVEISKDVSRRLRLQGCRGLDDARSADTSFHPGQVSCTSGMTGRYSGSARANVGRAP